MFAKKKMEFDDGNKEYGLSAVAKKYKYNNKESS